MGENLLAVETSDRAEVGYRTGAKLKEQDCSPPQKGREGRTTATWLEDWKTIRPFYVGRGVGVAYLSLRQSSQACILAQRRGEVRRKLQVPGRLCRQFQLPTLL